jgi:anti-sigma factor RsiW
MDKTMDCKQVRNKLTAYLDGELAPLLSRGIHDHLEGCPACRREVERLEAVWGLLDGARVPSPPDGLPEAIMKGIVSGEAGPVTRAGRARILPWPMAVAAAAAAAAGIVIGFLIGSALPGAPRATAAQAEPAAEVGFEEGLLSELPPDSVGWTLVELIDGENGNGSGNGEGEQ